MMKFPSTLEQQTTHRKGYNFVKKDDDDYDDNDDEAFSSYDDGVNIRHDGPQQSFSSDNHHENIHVQDEDCVVTNTGHNSTNNTHVNNHNKTGQTIAGIIGNVLEWYDFAVFGYLSDILGEVFFPPTSTTTNNDNSNDPSNDIATTNHIATMESFMVFGAAFIMRPIGGIMIGHIGDTYGRKNALIVSIYLMAIPTFCMGCLPSYQQVGIVATLCLIIIRLLQGLSVGGQLMSSLVFTLENQPKEHWGLYGSYVMAAANCGTLLGGTVGFLLRSSLSHEQLVDWGWRIPFLAGIIVSFAGCYLQQSHPHAPHNRAVNDYEDNQLQDHHQRTIINDEDDLTRNSNNNDDINDLHLNNNNSTNDKVLYEEGKYLKNPCLRAIEPQNLRALLSATMVPILWSSGFYLSFVWMAIYMSDFIPTPVPGSFGVDSAALLVSVCLFFPIAGILSDQYSRRIIMSIGGIGIAVLGYPMIVIIGMGQPLPAFLAQCVLGICLSFWGAPMCSWLVESFEPTVRLTSVSIGYNVAHAIAGGTTPALATWLVDNVSIVSPGIIYIVVACVSLFGLLCIAPPLPTTTTTTISMPTIKKKTSALSCTDNNNIEMSSIFATENRTEHTVI